MSLILFPFLGACLLVITLFALFKQFEPYFRKPDPKADTDIREELEGSIWVLEDGTEAVFQDVVDGGRYFKLETIHGETVTVLATTIFRVGQQPMVKEIV